MPRSLTKSYASGIHSAGMFEQSTIFPDDSTKESTQNSEHNSSRSDDSNLHQSTYDIPSFIRQNNALIALTKEFKTVIQKLIAFNESSIIHQQYFNTPSSSPVQKRTLSYEPVPTMHNRQFSSENIQLNVPRQTQKNNEKMNAVPSDIMKRTFKNPNFYSSGYRSTWDSQDRNEHTVIAPESTYTFIKESSARYQKTIPQNAPAKDHSASSEPSANPSSRHSSNFPPQYRQPIISSKTHNHLNQQKLTSSQPHPPAKNTQSVNRNTAGHIIELKF